MKMFGMVKVLGQANTPILFLGLIVCKLVTNICLKDLENESFF